MRESLGEYETILGLLKVRRCYPRMLYCKVDVVSQTYDAYISGSFPLYLAMREGSWQPGDIDVYISYHAYDAFVAAFVEKMNATKVELKGRASAEGKLEVSYGVAIDYVQKYRTAHANFDLIRSVDKALLPITKFHSTVVTNVLTYDHLLVVFPQLTLNKMGIKGDGLETERVEVALKKYEQRGFTFKTKNLYGPVANYSGGLRIAFDGTTRTMVEGDGLYEDFGYEAAAMRWCRTITHWKDWISWMRAHSE